MHDYERLAHLAGLYGIDRGYWDIWGARHEASEETLLRVLAAMGVELTGEDGLERAIDLAENEHWLRTLAPVYVFDEDEALSVRVSVPARLCTETIRWRFVREDGHTELGSVRPADSEAVETAAVHGEEYAGHDLTLPVTPGIGYHAVELSGSVEARAPVIVVPRHCHTPEALRQGGRVWGVALQLYSLRSSGNWGMGDFTDLKKFIEVWAELGADLVGLNPLHSLFPGNPSEYCPYYPSSRHYINVMYLDPCAVDDFAECSQAAALYESEAFQERLARARGSETVDNTLVYPLKLEMMELLYESFLEKHVKSGTWRAAEFGLFKSEHGETLRQNSLFEALQEKFSRLDPAARGWMDWPEEYRDPASEAAASFARDHADRVDFYSYLQWQAFVQLDRAGAASMERGLKVGIYQDLAVGCSARGAEVWSDRALYALGISVGAPPDDFNLSGQSWGLPPMVPKRLRDEAYAPFIEVLRCNMRDAGALRLDHVIGLMRLFWVPAGESPAEGTYVRYPFADLMRIVALESVRNGCLVIGEDLGTVPPEVPARMQAMDMLSFRVFYWEMDNTGEYRPPPDFPRNALVTVSTHDLPTLAGYWEGLDIALRDSLGAFSSPEVKDAQVRERASCKAKMLRALSREGLLPEGVTEDPESLPVMTDGLSRAIHGYIARSASKLMMVQVEDAAGGRDQVNMPGTGGELPNWRRRVGVPVEDMAADGHVRALAAALREERPRG